MPPPDLERIFAVQHDRTVANDNTMQYGRVTFQIAASPLRCSFAKCRVVVYEHLDGRLSIGYGPHTLGRYDLEGHALNGNGRAAVEKLNHHHNRTDHKL